MADRIAIKRLTASDCTLFEAVFRKIGAGNQKSINLNADVLTGRLYPNLAGIAAMTENEVALSISIFGPNAKGAHKLSRKIIKNPTYKNWRLNGEFISGPPDDVARYDDVKPGDMAIMAFSGEAAPNRMDLILVGQGSSADRSLHGALVSLFGNKSMIAVSAAELAAAANSVGVLESHPVYLVAVDFEMQAALEDAAQSGFQGTGKILRNRGGKKVSASDLAKAKFNAEQIGRDGEGLINAHLAAKLATGQLTGYVWTSSENAIAPYDFDTTSSSNRRTFIDAKTTVGPFRNMIHLSLAEIVEATGDVPYRIYRVFEITENGGKLRVSEEISPLAKALKDIHERHMPPGIKVDSFSVATDALQWGEEEYIERPEDEDTV